MTRTAGLAMLIAVSACCKSAPEPVTASFDPLAVKACEEPVSHACPRTSCGGNSEAVNNFPTNGARPDGECNKEGVQLMPGSMTGGIGGKCQGATLVIRDNKLLGIDPYTGAEKCKELDLQGATFSLRSWVKKNGVYQALKVHIARVDPTYHADAIQHPRMAYLLADDQGRSLCSTKGSAEARQALGIDPLDGLTEPTPTRDLVIPIRSELYNRDGQPWPVDTRWKLREAEWMHFACVDDALAKRSLYSLDGDDVNVSRAALMMFMANYCGDVHATVRGTLIEWKMFDDAASPATDSRRLEAKWGPTGAVCMSNPRALYAAGDNPQVPQSPAVDFALIAASCPDCTPDTWTSTLRKCEAWKLKKTPMRATPLPTCEACTADECKGVLLHSFVVTKPAP